VPLYEYVCKKCHHRFEKIQKFSDPKIKKCPECGGPVEQAIHAPAVQFKGTGWYVTDYAKKSGDSKESSDKPEKKEAAGAAKETGSASREKSDDKPKKSTSKKHD
jgi:putative FmdB family regulatory protein